MLSIDHAKNLFLSFSQCKDRYYLEGVGNGGLSSSWNRRSIGSLAEQLTIEQKHKRAVSA